MQNKLCLFILSLFVAISATAQNIEISVKLGNDPAEYAFIFKNGSCLGNCDSLGRFYFQVGAIERGDSLMASVAGISSDVIVYDGNARSVTLNVKTGELAGAKVVEKNLRRVDEYVSLVHSVPFKWMMFGRRFHCEYEIGKDSGASGQVADFTILDNSDRRFLKDKGDVLIYSFGNNSDDKMVGGNVYNSYVILGKILNRHSERLKDECASGRMLVHKLSDDGETSYLLIDKSGENSQILVRFDERKELHDVPLTKADNYKLNLYLYCNPSKRGEKICYIQHAVSEQSAELDIMIRTKEPVADREDTVKSYGMNQKRLDTTLLTAGFFASKTIGVDLDPPAGNGQLRHA